MAFNSLPAASQEPLPPFAVMVPHGIHAKAATAAMATRLFGMGGPSINNQKSFYARKPSSSRARNGYDSDSDSESGEQKWDCFYQLDLANLRIDSEDIGFRIGTGISGHSIEDRGVDVLTSYPGENSYNVSGVHCELLLSSAGVWQIKSTSETKTTRVGHKYDFVNLGKGETYLPRFKTNRLKIGKWEAEIIFNTYSTKEYAIYLKRLHRILEWNGRLIPDPRIWVLPTYRDFLAIGPAIVQGSVQGVANGVVRVGVHLHTGQALAVTTIFIKSLDSWSILNPHLKALLSFKGAQGLIQALEIRCDHGHVMNHEFLAELLAEQDYGLQHFCKENSDMIHIISELPSSNFRDFSWKQQQFPMKLTRLREIFLGIKILHEGNIVHGNISEETTFIISENPFRAAVGGLGEVLEIETSSNAEGMEHVTRPTTKPNDIRDLAGVALKMFLPRGDNFTDSESTKEETWPELITSFLTTMASEGPVQARVAHVLNDMLCIEAKQRPTAAMALAALPEYCWISSSYKELSDYSSPQKDAQKRLRDVQDDESFEGDLHGDSSSSPPMQKKTKHLADAKAKTSSPNTNDSHGANVQAALLTMREMMKIKRELNIALQKGVTIRDLRAYSQGEDADILKDLQDPGSDSGYLQILCRATSEKHEQGSALSTRDVGFAAKNNNSEIKDNDPNGVDNGDNGSDTTKANIHEADDVSDDNRERHESAETSAGEEDAIRDDEATEDAGNSSQSSSNDFGDEEDFSRELDRVSEEMRITSQTPVTTIFTQTQEGEDLSAPSSEPQENQIQQQDQPSCSSEESEEE